MNKPDPTPAYQEILRLLEECTPEERQSLHDRIRTIQTQFWRERPVKLVDPWRRDENPV